MARGSSLTMITGYVGKAPVEKYMPDKTLMISFSIAVNKSYKNQESGEKIDKTVWHPMRAYGPRAETLKNLKAGSLLQTFCSYKNGSFDGKDGQPVYFHYFNIEKFDFLDKLDKSEAGAQSTNNQAPAPEPEQPQFDDFDDDIPF